MNPETNRFEPLKLSAEEEAKKRKREVDFAKEELRRLLARQSLVRPDGSPVPQNWSIFTVGELVVIKDYTYRVAYINEVSITFESVGPTDVDLLKVIEK